MTPPWFKSVKEILLFHVDGFMRENQEVRSYCIRKKHTYNWSLLGLPYKPGQDRTIVKPKEKLSIWNVYKTLKPPVKAEGPLF